MDLRSVRTTDKEWKEAKKYLSKQGNTVSWFIRECLRRVKVFYQWIVNDND
jgi:hypothetical protein